jgi:hypothetical protein
MTQILITANDNRFIIGNKNLYISFTKESQEIFSIIKQYNTSELFIITAPGSFVGIRNIVSFCLGFSFQTTISLKSFNILVDILPYIYICQQKDTVCLPILYFWQELNRFFYCIYADNLNTRVFFLLSYMELINIKEKNNYFFVGNHVLADYYIQINFFDCFHYIKLLLANHQRSYTFSTLEYCDSYIYN